MKHQWTLSHEFLAGDVVAKYNEVLLKRDRDPSWEKEFEALYRVQPTPVSIAEIEINPGDTWMGQELISQIYYEFCLYKFGVRMLFDYVVIGNIGVWKIECLENHEVDSNKFRERFILDGREQDSNIYFAVHKEPKKGIFTMMFYGKQPVGKYSPDKSKPQMKSESDTLTEKLRIRQKLFAQEFDRFCKQEYGLELEELYNAKVTAIVPRKWEGTGRHLQYLLSHIGMSEEWQKRLLARPYQLDGAWRLIADQNNVLLGHEVGLGKTAISCLALIYRIKMGLTKKAMIVVQKSTLLQFGATFQQMFPTARLLVMDTEKVSKHNRQRFLAEAQLNNYDAILITHEAFETIDLSPDAIESYFSLLIEDIAHEVEQSCKYDKEGNKAKSQTKFHKDCLAIYENYLKIINRAKEKIYDAGSIFFDQLGIDLLIYDEAQKVKNGLFISFSEDFPEHSPSNFASSSSNIAADFFFKSEIMRQQQGKQSLWLLTGTPEPTNSPKGVYFMLRVLIPELLNDFGVLSFDAFVSHYIEFSDEPEFKPDGSIREARRMTGIKNNQSLARLLQSCYDIKRYDDVKHYFPNGFRPKEKFIRLECPMSEFQLEYMNHLKVRYEQWCNPYTPNDEKIKYPMRDKDGYLMWQPQTFVDIGMGDRRDCYDKPSERYRQYLIHPYTGEKLKSIHDPYYDQAKQEVLDLIIKNTSGDENAGLLPPSEQYKYFYTVDTFFQIYTDATKLMLDERLVRSQSYYDDGIDEVGPINPDGKIMMTSRYVADWYKGSVHKRTTCVIFLDMGAPNSSMKFSCYQEIKSCLIDLGVPAEEIAFIQDYDTDDKKLKLFDRFNKGEIRILLGHTRSLGIGVNIQERLELMMLIDIPKTPDMHEQRIGRILRSGNTNSEVTICQVLTKGKPGSSYGADPHAFNLLTRKIKIREEIFKFNATVSKIQTDTSDSEALFELLKAHATGDPRLLEYKEKKTKLDKFIKSKETVERDLAIKLNPKSNNSIEGLNRQLDLAIKVYDARCQDFELLKGIDFDNFTITLGKKKFIFQKHKGKVQPELTTKSYSQTESEFLEYFQKVLRELLDQSWLQNYDHKYRGVIGSFNETFPIHAHIFVKSFNQFTNNYEHNDEWILMSPTSGKGYSFSVSASNTLKSIIKNLQLIEKLVTDSKKTIAKWQKEIENTTKKIEADKSQILSFQSSIDSLKPEVDRLGAILGMNDLPSVVDVEGTPVNNLSE